MATNRIENAKTGRSSCRLCGLTIDEGSPRWGNDDGVTSKWMHLRCAVDQKPRGFKPFTKKAEAALATYKPAKKKKAGPAKRNPALEAAIVKDPTNRDAINVLGDWLQAENDPWGEIIALQLADPEENDHKVNKLLRAHAADLCGGFAPKFFFWERGIIHTAILEAKKPPQMIALMEGVFKMRTAFALRRLNLPIAPTKEILAAVAWAPPTLRSLYTFANGTGLGALAHATLESLELRAMPRSDDELRELFQVKGLPNVRRFEWVTSSGEPLRVSALETLLGSPLFQKIEELRLYERALDDAGSAFLLANVDRLKRLRGIDFHPSRATERALRKALKKQIDGYVGEDDF